MITKLYPKKLRILYLSQNLTLFNHDLPKVKIVLCEVQISYRTKDFENLQTRRFKNNF